ncbi:glycosyltransferase family 8 protein [Pontibacter virosus]|uniref:Lipopolysaccharide biosynthesis glycosyltransferase n=1 Tax=Pontibacter virosus TaxID=1765052 RepID=A0A2U1AQH4_9BACT|nr:glycosyltransferase family 8 protein [Pontibacter virosus]PVY38673.1 lipopolysaccharide biosynthesis glycosyltransferase [Pontibacter virosus]
MNIAFCINRLGLVGLGATLSSLIRNCSNQSRLKLWFVCADMKDNEKLQIVKLLKMEGFSGTYSYVNYNPKLHFGAFPSLHGDWTAYGRLLLANLLEEDQVLYLDSDLIVEEDVLKVEAFDFVGHILAAVGGGQFKYTLGNKFYIKTVGMPPEAEYFNSGVLLLNLKAWRQVDVFSRCVEIARKYPVELPSHDQSLLNIICSGNFAKLPPSFNCEWEAYESEPQVADKMILHFIGSPKPWDPLGFILHNGYSKWLKYADKEWSAFFQQITIAELVRVWHIRKSYIRTVLRKLKT